MSTRRFAYAFVVLASLAVVTVCDHMVLGDREDGDILIESTNYEVSFKGNATYRAENGKKITAVLLKDLNDDLDGSWARILEGGPGKCYITIGFYGRPGAGIQYEVEVYAV